ncbi:hypothetical protein Goari_014126, partial [Gossypium aridum]|nr:hypothetical protein [Gossypium aridum]
MRMIGLRHSSKSSGFIFCSYLNLYVPLNGILLVKDQIIKVVNWSGKLCTTLQHKDLALRN